MTKSDQILSAAYTVFIEKGYHNTTMMDLAEKANMKRTTLYDYYPSKEEIVILLLDKMFSENPLSEPSGNLISQIEQLISQMLWRTAKHIELYRILFESSPTLSDRSKHAIITWQQPFIQILSNIITTPSMTEEEVKHLSFLIRSLISTKMSDYIMLHQPIDIDKDIEMLLSMIRRYCHD